MDNHAVHPHDIVVVSGHEAGQRVETGEEQRAHFPSRSGTGGQSVPFACPGQPGTPPEIEIRGQPRQPNLEHDQVTHEFHQVALRHQQGKYVEGTCQVIYKKRKKIRAYPHVEGEAQILPSPHLVEQLTEKRHVLVVHIGKQEAPVPKGIDPVHHEQCQHDHGRNQKREDKGCPLPISC